MNGKTMVEYKADWAVSEVGRREKNGEILKYKVRSVWKLGDIEYLGEPFVISRNGLKAMIETDKKKVITVYKKDGITLPGEDVRITEPGYLRTDANDTEEDNLGSLPEMT